VIAGLFGVYGLILLVLVAGARMLARTLLERPGPRGIFARGKEALVVGAGDAGNALGVGGDEDAHGPELYTDRESGEGGNGLGVADRCQDQAVEKNTD